jgi:hypothetical protein
MPSRNCSPANGGLFALASLGLGLWASSTASAALKTFTVVMEDHSAIIGVMSIATLGDPVVLSATYFDYKSIIPVPVPLIGENMTPLASISATRIYRGGAVLVIEPISAMATEIGLDTSFAIVQWQNELEKFHSIQWSPTEVPLLYLTNVDEPPGPCIFAPDPADPYQNFVSLPDGLELVVIEVWDADPPYLEGFVFLPGADGCWNILFSPVIMGPPSQPTEAEVQPIIIQ